MKVSFNVSMIIMISCVSQLYAFQIHDTTLSSFRKLSFLMAGVTSVELKPEPQVGVDILPIDTLPNTRVKNLGPKDIKSEDGQVYQFWLKTEAKGSLISELRQQVVKESAKHANFPGFRKGQIPPYAQSKMTTFAVQEGIIKTCEAAVKAYGLKALAGSDGSVEVHEDVNEISKIYKIGDNVPFTATFLAVFDAEKQKKVDVAEE
jgi:hypothetical protein